MAYRVPVPVHINNLGTPRVQQIGQLSAKPAVAVLPETAGLQSSTDSNDHMCKLLSLPSFGKVVYRSSNFGPTSLAVSKQCSLSGPAARVGTGIESQQMLLQGHASSLSRPPSLEFDSQFESGNLQKAVQASDHLYHLWSHHIDSFLKVPGLHAFVLTLLLQVYHALQCLLKDCPSVCWKSVCAGFYALVS